MKWIGNRISYRDTDIKTTIVITPENVGFYKAIIGAWFFMWLTIGAVMIWGYNTFPFKADMKDQLSIMFLIFMLFWTYYFIRVGRMFFWLLYGSENIKLDKISLTIKTSIKGYGKAKQFYIENIEKVRVSIPKENSFQAAWENSPWIRGGERLEFDYLGKTIRFGRKLNEQESKLLFQLLTKRLDEHVKRRKKEA
ncbi:MAG: hypothetical protein IT221_14435 [Fluviicola sp.]|nr:hypothetical protein [Fluviicola sp.]